MEGSNIASFIHTNRNSMMDGGAEMSRKVIILGAGYAGVEAALTLHRKKKKGEALEICLIDRNPYHTLLTELHEVAGNRIDEDGIIVPLYDIFRYTGVRVIQDDIRTFDLEHRKIASERCEYSFDYLILAAGSNPNFFGIPGMQENSFPLWSFDDAVRVRNHIRDCFLKAAQEEDPQTRQRLLTFVVGGGGFTGIEMMGELALWVKLLCREVDINRRDVRLVVVEALPHILSTLRQKNREKVTRYLRSRLQVEVLTDAPITRLDGYSLQLKNGQSIQSSTVIWTAGVKACDITGAIPLPKGNACRLEVDEYTGTNLPHVFAAGDIALFKKDDGYLPAMVETALQTGKAAAANVLASVRGTEQVKLKPEFHGTMVSVGSFYAVAEIMGISLPRLFAVVMKYLVNIHYLFGIGGFELVFRYLKHEFLYKRQHKPMLEAFITRKTMAVWLVPLRLFLGFYWFTEGLKKAQDGWFVIPMLAGRAPDAQSSASVTAEGEKIFRIISEHTPEWYEWIAETFILPWPLLFQFLIVLTEVGLGLAFFTGTLTIPAAVVALGLNVNFLLSTGMYPESYWLIPAQLAMFADAGKSFGGDYFLMPYLMRQWRFFTRNKRIKPFLFR